jgi:hypothetical protein
MTELERLLSQDNCCLVSVASIKKALEQEPCEDAISRQVAIDAIKEIHPIDTEYDCTLYDKIDVIYVLKDLPSVNLQPKTGHWIDDEFGSKCSCCGIHTHLDKFGRPMKFKCCSMCGAKMIEPQESEDKE